ncbi:acyl-CoA dehydrogenase family protein [Acerihabitans sp. KWT182]|uniref:Acyl-CoA dehydrogenase family protein n=1 Tax=Acerihabitans sp. KWT182 TaxID=3157919 RepID=A0AAU7QEQ0_9GAMM
MTIDINAWGVPPGERYKALAEQFRPLFEKIRAGALAREINRTLPFEQIGWLKEARFGALRVPEEFGGFGATLPELFGLLIELSAADSNITQALRGHFALVEDILNTKIAGRREKWLPRFATGQIAGNAWTELDSSLRAFSSRVSRDGGEAYLDGTKYYTTGSVFADWIHVGCVNDKDEPISAIVHRHARGVTVADDWDGFGQTLTASGTTIFDHAPLEWEDVAPEDDRFPYSPAFYQLIILAALAGVGRAAADEAAGAVARRRRTYSHAAAERAGADPQVLQIVGRIQGAAFGAGAIVLKVAEALADAHDRLRRGDAATDEAVALAELQAAQAQTVVSGLVLDATALIFDALGASAVRRGSGLDRHWRNARTLSSHNPRIYKDRIVGDYAVNGTPPPPQWTVGNA